MTREQIVTALSAERVRLGVYDHANLKDEQVVAFVARLLADASQREAILDDIANPESRLR